MSLPSRHIHQTFSIGSSLLRLADAASVAGGLLLALRFAGLDAPPYALHGAAAVIVHYLVAEFSGMYRSWRGASPEREIFGSLFSWSTSFAILIALGFATGRLAEFPRSLLALWLVFTPLLTVASHTIQYRVRSDGE